MAEDTTNSKISPQGSGAFRMPNSESTPNKYRSLPPSSPVQKSTPADTPGPRYKNQPKRGFGSPRSNQPFASNEESQAFYNQRKQAFSQGLAGGAVQGFKQGDGSQNPSIGSRFKQAGKKMTQSLLSSSLRFGTNKTFYWLLGLVLPSFGLSIIGLDLLWLLSASGKARNSGIVLKLWQKITILLLNIAVPMLIFIAVSGFFVYTCNYSPEVLRLGVKFASKAGQLISDNPMFQVCEFFKMPGGGESKASGSLNSTPVTVGASETNLRGLGIVPWNGPDPYPGLDFGDQNPLPPADVKNRLNELKAVFEILKRRWANLGNGTLVGRQAYRPQAYQAHIRSVLEVYRSSIGAPTRVSADSGCEGYNSLPNNIWDTLSTEEKAAAQLEFKKHALSGNGYEIACISDHAKGEAIDIVISGLSSEKFNELVIEADKVGLCNNVINDKPHFVLKKYSPADINCFINLNR